MIPVNIDSVRVSLVSQHRLIVLREQGSSHYLPIWIGAFEAEAITMKLQGATLARPMTHDLLLRCIGQMGGEVMRVVITDLRQDTFYASIYIQQNGNEVVVDARPSDAIALAVRADAPLFVAESVIENAAIEPDSGPWQEGPQPSPSPIEPEESEDTSDDLSAFRDFIDGLDLDDLNH